MFQMLAILEEKLVGIDGLEKSSAAKVGEFRKQIELALQLVIDPKWLYRARPGAKECLNCGKCHGRLDVW
jgi:hypothetical protein